MGQNAIAPKSGMAKHQVRCGKYGKGGKYRVFECVLMKTLLYISEIKYEYLKRSPRQAEKKGMTGENGAEIYRNLARI